MWRPHVTTHRSRSKVSSSSSTFTTLPPCTPSTRRALLFYYSTRPRRVRLVASAYIPRDLSSPSPSLSFSLALTLFLPLFLFFPLSFLSSSPRPPLASRLTEKLESRRRIRGSSGAAAAAAVARCVLLTSSLLPSPPSPRSSFTISLSWFRYVSLSRGSFSCHFIIRFTDTALPTRLRRLAY